MADQLRSFGKYEIRGEIARGGFATVYRAYDTHLDREVALKVLAPHLAWEANFAARFQQEARVAARLKHTNIVTIYEIGEEDGALFIAMELAQAGSLRDKLAKAGPLSVEETIELLGPIAAALDFAHVNGIIHRDVKPANILLDFDENGQVRPILTDFGLVKALANSAELTQSGAIIGTVEYMAPEQADTDLAEQIGPATDIYGFGVVAYHMLTGQVPFSDSSAARVLVAHLTKEPPPPSSIRHDLPESVSDVILRALAKQPQDRYATATAFVQALKATTQPPPPVETPAEETSPTPPPAPPSTVEPEQERIAPLPAQEEAPTEGRKRSRKVIAIVGVGVVLLALLCCSLIWFSGQSGSDSAPTILSFQAEPAVIERGQRETIRLTWQVENAETIEILPDVGDFPGEDNSIEMPAPENTMEYTLVAYNATGERKAQTMVEVREPGARQENWVNIIELSPPSPAEVKAGQPVRIRFEYETVEPEGVSIFVRPFSGDEVSTNYSASGSPLYDPGGGLGESEFTIADGPVTVDRLFIQMLSGDQTRLLFESFVPVHYQFSPG